MPCTAERDERAFSGMATHAVLLLPQVFSELSEADPHSVTCLGCNDSVGQAAVHETIRGRGELVSTGARGGRRRPCDRGGRKLPVGLVGGALARGIHAFIARGGRPTMSGSVEGCAGGRVRLCGLALRPAPHKPLRVLGNHLVEAGILHVALHHIWSVCCSEKAARWAVVERSVDGAVGKNPENDTLVRDDCVVVVFECARGVSGGERSRPKFTPSAHLGAVFVEDVGKENVTVVSATEEKQALSSGKHLAGRGPIARVLVLIGRNKGNVGKILCDNRHKFSRLVPRRKISLVVKEQHKHFVRNSVDVCAHLRKDVIKQAVLWPKAAERLAVPVNGNAECLR
eukprot:Opistho-2@63451